MSKELLQQALELAMRCPWSEERAKLADTLRSALAAPAMEAAMADGTSFETFDELVKWAAWQIVEAICTGKPIRQAMYGILMVARSAKIGGSK